MAPPVVTIITALPPATRTTPIVFTVVGDTVPLRRAWASLALPGIVGDEAIHNSDRFGAFYTGGINTRASIENGYQFTVLRDGGWPDGSLPLASSFTINAVDTLGNGT